MKLLLAFHSALGRAENTSARDCIQVEDSFFSFVTFRSLNQRVTSTDLSAR